MSDDAAMVLQHVLDEAGFITDTLRQEHQLTPRLWIEGFVVDIPPCLLKDIECAGESSVQLDTLKVRECWFLHS